MIAALLFASEAGAVTATFCVDWEGLNYADRTVGTRNTFESLTAPARRAKIRFKSGSTTIDDRLNDSGCLTRSLDGALQWDVILWLDVQVGTNTLRLVANGTDRVPRVIDLVSGLTVSNGATYDNSTWTNGVDTNGVLVLAAAQHALSTWDLNVTNKVIDIDLFPGDADACDGDPLHSCFNEATPYANGQFTDTPLHVSDDPVVETHRQKFTIAHELGHVLWWFVNGATGANAVTPVDYNATGGVCGPFLPATHFVHSKEFASAATIEAWADFYAAVVFNDDGAATCEYDAGGPLDWDRNLTNEAFTKHSCDGAVIDPMTLAALTNATDYHGQYCGGANYRAVQFDWLRLLWNLRTDHAWPRPTFRDLWDATNAHGWMAGAPASGASAATMPYNRITAVVPAAKLGTWTAQAAAHGVARSPDPAP